MEMCAIRGVIIQEIIQVRLAEHSSELSIDPFSQTSDIAALQSSKSFVIRNHDAINSV